MYRWMICLGVSTSAFANHEDIKIDAQGRIDYYDKEDMCIAQGGVHVIRGEEHLFGDKIKIYFLRQGSHRTLSSIEAFGHAHLQSPEGSLDAPRLRYDILTQTLHALGKDIVLKTPSYVLHATESMRYCRSSQTGDAVGHVHFIQDEKSVKADRVGLIFSQNQKAPAGKTEKKSFLGDFDNKVHLISVTATGNVILTDQDQQGWSNTAVYDAQTECATLKGKVRLRKGKDFAKGDQGWFDFKHKKMGLDFCGQGGRVRLLVHPAHLKRNP